MSLPRPRVLVTRAEPGASLTATRLAELGLEPIVEPLLTLQQLPVTSIPAFDALAFTSPNGARLFAQLSPRRDAPVFCVGQRTADVARQAGFPIAMSSDGDVVALAQVIARHLAPGARLLHAGNAESRGGLTERLRAIGCSAEFLAIYVAQPPANPGPILARHLAGDASFDAALIHSPRAGTILGDFLAASPRHATVSVAAISQAAADPLIPHAHRLAIAAEPNELALLTALDDLFGGA